MKKDEDRCNEKRLSDESLFEHVRTYAAALGISGLDGFVRTGFGFFSKKSRLFIALARSSSVSPLRLIPSSRSFALAASWRAASAAFSF